MMTLLANLISNDWAAISLITIYSIFSFILLGRIVLSLFKYQNRNSLLSIPVGFISYQLITFASLVPFIIFNVDTDVYYWITIVKNIFILSIIVIFYKQWMPKRNQFNPNSLTKGIAGITLITLISVMFISMSEYLPWFSHFDPNSIFYEATVKISEATGSMHYLPEGLNSIYTIFQTYYYDIAMISRIGDVSVELIFKILIPTWTLTIIFSSFKHSFRDIGTSKSLFAALVLTILTIFLISSFSPDEGMFMGVSMFIASIAILYNDSTNRESSSRNLIMALLAITTLFFMYSNAIPFLILFSIIISFYTIKREGDQLQIFTIILLVLAIQSSLVLYNFTWWWGVLSASIFTIFILPVWNLQYGGRREERISASKTILQYGKWIVVSVSAAVIFSGMIISITKTPEFVQTAENIYLNLFATSSKTANISLSILFNIFIIYIPIVIFGMIIWLYDDKLSNTFIYLIIWIFVILFNPFSALLWETIFTTEIDLRSISTLTMFVLILNIKDFITKTIFYKEV